MQHIRTLLFAPIILTTLMHHHAYAPVPQREPHFLDSQQLFDTPMTLEQFFVNVIHSFAAIVRNPHNTVERGRNVFNIVLHVVHFAFTQLYYRSGDYSAASLMSDATVAAIAHLTHAHHHAFTDAVQSLQHTQGTKGRFCPFEGVCQELLMEHFEQFAEHFVAIMHAPGDTDMVAKHLPYLIEGAQGITALAFATGNYGVNDLALGLLPFDEDAYDRMGRIIVQKAIYLPA